LSDKPVTRRLFFALWPDDATRVRIARLARELPRKRGRPMVSENLHATLAFVGNVSESAASCLETRAAKVPLAPFDLQLDRTGCFSRAGVMWLGAGQIPSALERMVRDLNIALAPCGYAPDPKPFHLHITLFRKARPSPETPEAVEPIPWRVEGFSLIESVSIRGGVRYHSVRDYTN